MSLISQYHLGACFSDTGYEPKALIVLGIGCDKIYTTLQGNCPQATCLHSSRRAGKTH